jgi:translation initiation factor IF-3
VLQDEYPASAGADKYGAAKKGPARDYDIAYPWIQLRQEDGRLSEPQRTTAVLRDMDLTRQTLILLAVPKLDGRSQGPQYPICRIGDRKAEEATQAEVAKKQGPKIVSKKLELNWAIAPNDLRTRMTQLKRLLSKGYQVEVTMAGPKRRGKRLATLDEAKEVPRVVRETVAEVPGAQEMKPMDGQVGDVLTLFLHAPTGKAESSAEKAPTGTQQGT